VFALSTSRLPFLLAVALVAAALGDALVEGVSNTGVFGSRYFDNDHLSVLPTLVAGLVLGIELLGWRCLRVFRRSWSARTAGRDWLVDFAARCAGRSSRFDVPLVFGLQIAALFVMEHVEQSVAGGGVTRATAWLGGPIIFSLMVHALVGTACTLLLAAAARSIVRTFASLVREALEAILFALARDGERGFAHRREHESLARAQAPHVRQLGGRAPPPLSLVV
jgi:hypothetical protein